MSALWFKEWREFAGTRRLLLLRLAIPVLLLGPLLNLPAARLPALAAALVYLGACGTATQVARERMSGFLPRLALTPVSPAMLVLHRALCRTLLLALQIAPLLILAAWRGAPAAELALLAPALPAACAAGALIGLRAPSRRAAQLTGLLTSLAAAGAGWSIGLSPLPGEAAAETAVMSMAGPGLPVHAALWLLVAALITAMLRAAPVVLGSHEE